MARYLPQYEGRREAEPARRFSRAWRRRPLRAQFLCASLALLLTAACLAQAPAQHADVIFQKLDRDSGLPSPIVQAVAQDGHGFLWVGTGSGVSRWDGYHFRSYGVEVGVAGALPDNDIYSMGADAAGSLWIGTRSRGVARYDSARDQFQTFAPPGKEKNFATVYSILADGPHGILLGTREGLDELDPSTGVFTSVALEGSQGRIAVESLVRDRDGRVWAGTTQGLFRSDGDGRHFTHQDVFGQAKVGIWRLRFDHDGRLWIGAVPGAWVLDPSQTTAQPIHETGPGPSPLDQEAVDAICEAKPGTIWLGTVGQGIVAVDAKTLETHRIVHDAGYPTSLPSDTVVTLLTDAAGSVWVGTDKGLGRAESSAGILTFYGAAGGAAPRAARIADSGVTSVLPVGQNHLWLGLNEKGLQLVSLDGATVTPIRQIAAGEKAPLPPGQINALASAPDGSLYVGTATWVYRVDGSGRLAALPRPSGPLARVDALLYESGTLWIGSHRGLWKQDLAHPRQPPVALPMTPAEITVLARGAGNDLWVATATELFRYDTATGATERIGVDPSNPHALPAPATSILLDRQQRLWATTWGGGVCLLAGRDAQSQPKFRCLTQGLPNTNADDALQAPDGKIWVSTDDGFAIIDPGTFAITSLSQADGVAIPAYWVKAGDNTADGRLVFGGDGGLTVIDPARFRPLTYAAPVVVTDILAGGKPVPFDRFNSVADSATLSIGHDANSVAVEFASLDYTGPALNLYAYKLDGFDKDWITTSSTRRVASYTNLPPGSYILELRGSNRDGVWGSVRTLRIHVVPAWYQTVWARTAAVVLLLLILTAAWDVGTMYQRSRQRELERRVEQRTAELKQITEELEESRRQLEKLAHSDALTGLPNRRMFNEHFRQLLALSQRHEKRAFTLIVFDLDKFKEINDVHGHAAGDACLKMVAQRLSPAVRDSDCFARLGGDEFALLVDGPIAENGLAALCARLAACVKAPLQVDESVVNPTLSIGVATYPRDGEEEAALLRAADAALYRVKRAGGNGWQRSSPAEGVETDVKGSAGD